MCTGAMFVACTVEHASCLQYRDLAIGLVIDDDGRGPVLSTVDSVRAEALTASIGFVNKGLMVAEMIPVGDEFESALELLQQRLGERLAGLLPLAAAGVNATARRRD